ncbi:DUF2569 domain-containing protein [Sphingopyxis sp. CCNWLW253]|uniref:DUF2569 family protein n=1 Tax=unclassified Sphingopyxis TaxID=2614943 RepID=UPI003012AFCA
MTSVAIRTIRERLLRQSIRFVAPLEGKVRALLLGWTIVVASICLARILFPASPAHGLSSMLILLVPHMLILASPFFAYWTANALFPRGTDFAQPEIRLARIGNWRPLDALAARDHSAFGPVGVMASLLLGMLLNIPIRTAEFMAGVPAMTGSAPIWGQMIYFAMATDLIVMNFLYTLCFFMALRRMPFFPRMLLLAWGVDVASQVVIAQYVSGAPNLPAQVAAAIAPLLESNLTKAFISIIVWMPYLILSERVNVTYRWRQPA